jgi:hypothetical protein
VRTPPQLEAFTSWLAAFGDAWEAADAGAMGELFVLGATYQPQPFTELLRGRRDISAHWQRVFEGLDGVQFGAQVLGAGDTYGVAHFRVSFHHSAGEGATVRDGILLAALDPRGRCTSLREWSHETHDRSPAAES